MLLPLPSPGGRGRVGISMRGIFITFEGIEGSGKSTLVSQLALLLKNKGIDPLITREPGGTALGRELRAILLNPAGADIQPLSELLLYAADRAQHIREVIGPALDEGKTVLCDRFSDATAAYQGYGRGIPLETIRSADGLAREGRIPDLTVLLDLPPDEGLERARSRNARDGAGAETRMDDEQPEFHRKVREGYLDLARQQPDRFLILDASNRPEHMASRVLTVFMERFPHAFR